MWRATLALSSIMFLAQPIHAETSPSVALAVSPISAVFGGADFLFQFKMNDTLALTATAGASYDWLKSKMVGHDRITRAPFSSFIGVGTKYLFKEQGFENTFFIEPRITAHYRQFGFRNFYKMYDSTSWSLSPKVMVGWDWFLASRLFMSLSAGIGIDFYVKKRDAKLPKSTDFWNKRILFPPRNDVVSIAFDGNFLIGVAW